MRVDGSVVHYLLSREFGMVTCDKAAQRTRVDYPMLFDASLDLSGHTVLAPDHETMDRITRAEGSICVCSNDVPANAARRAGMSVIQVHGGVTFQHLFNYMQAEFVNIERLDAQLRAYVDTHAGAHALLKACADVTGCLFSLVDERYRPICEVAAGPASAGRGFTRSNRITLDPETVDLFMASRNYQHMRLRRNVFTAPGSGNLLMKNIFVGSNLRGMMVSQHEGNPLSARYVRFILSYLSDFVEETYATMGSFGIIPTESDHIRAALRQLLAGGSANRLSIQSLLQENGHPNGGRYVVLQIERSFTNESAEDYDYLARRLETSWPLAYCFTTGEKLFMFADISENATPANRDFLTDILIIARENLSKIGLSRPFSDLSRLDAARMQATAALRQGSVADPTFWFYRFSDYALDWLIEHGRGDAPISYFVHPALDSLIAFDAEHGSELVNTLDTFIRCRYSATRAADELYVARSTLINRLKRIAELTGVDFDDADDLLYLCLSLRYRNDSNNRVV